MSVTPYQYDMYNQFFLLFVICDVRTSAKKNLAVSGARQEEGRNLKLKIRKPMATLIPAGDIWAIKRGLYYTPFSFQLTTSDLFTTNARNNERQ